MEDLDILGQLYRGNHLEPKELERASKVLYILQQELNQRVR